MGPALLPPAPPMFLTLLLALAAASPRAEIERVGTLFPSVPLEGLAQSPAGAIEEYAGRLVLIEFFAYW